MEKSADYESKRVVTSYATGTAPLEELSAEMVAAWRSLLDDSDFAEEAARTLGTTVENVRTLSDPPFELRPGHQGLGVVETAIVVFIGQAALDLGKDLVTDAAKAGLKKLWGRIKTRMGLGLPLSAFGSEGEVEEAGDVPTGPA